MRFSTLLLAFLPAALCAPITIANPTSVAKRAPQLLGDLGSELEGLGELLSGESLAKINNIIDEADALLTPTFVNQTQTLISEASTLLPSLAALLGGLKK